MSEKVSAKVKDMSLVCRYFVIGSWGWGDERRRGRVPGPTRRGRPTSSVFPGGSVSTSPNLDGGRGQGLCLVVLQSIQSIDF